MLEREIKTQVGGAEPQRHPGWMEGIGPSHLASFSHLSSIQKGKATWVLAQRFLVGSSCHSSRAIQKASEEET